ncbi:MAG TPA: hypothetical protein VLA77_02670 [Candidatus Saccharimonadales bacterium]|nr:hypothetical protein [Candidatus Saccharimonadales bacterium]
MNFYRIYLDSQRKNCIDVPDKTYELLVAVHVQSGFKVSQIIVSQLDHGSIIDNRGATL